MPNLRLDFSIEHQGPPMADSECARGNHGTFDFGIMESSSSNVPGRMASFRLPQSDFRANGGILAPNLELDPLQSDRDCMIDFLAPVFGGEGSAFSRFQPLPQDGLLPFHSSFPAATCCPSLELFQSHMLRHSPPPCDIIALGDEMSELSDIDLGSDGESYESFDRRRSVFFVAIQDEPLSRRSISECHASQVGPMSWRGLTPQAVASGRVNSLSAQRAGGSDYALSFGENMGRPVTSRGHARSESTVKDVPSLTGNRTFVSKKRRRQSDLAVHSYNNLCDLCSDSDTENELQYYSPSGQ